MNNVYHGRSSVNGTHVVDNNLHIPEAENRKDETLAVGASK
jgi:hypothetical protein